MRRAARAVALLGALGVGWLLLGSRPRDVVLVYDVSAVPNAYGVDVKISRGGELVRRATLLVPSGAQVRHRVRLAEGTYHLAWWVSPEVASLHDPVAHGERDLVVDGDQTIVLPLGR